MRQKIVYKEIVDSKKVIMDQVRFIFCDLNSNLCKEWEETIKSVIPESKRELFSVFHGRLGDYEGKFDCIVSPANSYARLDGSFDHVISKMFSPSNLDAVTEHCQEYVHGVNNGYVTPGTALLIPMHHFEEKRFGCRYIALCPTMRVPESCVWNREVVYNCMWNLLAELQRHNKLKGLKGGDSPGSDTITSVLITGLGTGVGGFSVHDCAYQMTMAWKHFYENLQKGNRKTAWSQMMEWDDDIKGFGDSICQSVYPTFASGEFPLARSFAERMNSENRLGSTFPSGDNGPYENAIYR